MLLPDELLSALSNTLPRVRLGAVEELVDLLRGTDGRMAAAARAALQELLGDDSRRVTEAAGAALAVYAVAGTGADTALDPTPGEAGGPEADAVAAVAASPPAAPAVRRCRRPNHTYRTSKPPDTNAVPHPNRPT